MNSVFNQLKTYFNCKPNNNDYWFDPLSALLSKHHAWSLLLNLAHTLGIISIPHYYKEQWKSTAHYWYTIAVTIITLLSAVSLTAALLVYSTQDMAEFCDQFMVTSFLVFFILGSFHLQLNLARFQRLIKFFESVCYHHRNNNIVRQYKRYEKLLTYAMLAVYGMVFVGLIAIFPFLPKLLFSQSQLDNLQRIYKLKYPHNALPAHFYIPWIDPSEPKYYVWLYLVQIYMSIILFVRIFLCLGFLLSGYCIQVSIDILISYTKLLGTVHTNSKGNPIFHTSIEKGEQIQVNFDETHIDALTLARRSNTALWPDSFEMKRTPGTRTLWSEPFKISKAMRKRNTEQYRRPELSRESEQYRQQMCWEYDYYFFKQIVKYHQKLRYMISELISVLTLPWSVLIIVQISTLCLHMFSLFVPNLLSPVAYFKTFIMTLVFGIGFTLVFLTGELVTTANLTWRTTLINSYWYKCSLRTQQAIPLLFLSTETNMYLSVKGLIPCNCRTMLKIIKTAYSMSNLMRIQRVKNI